MHGDVNNRIFLRGYWVSGAFDGLGGVCTVYYIPTTRDRNNYTSQPLKIHIQN